MRPRSIDDATRTDAPIPGALSWRPGKFGWALVAAALALSVCVVVPLVLTGSTITGGDGLFPVDQMQYLSWIRQASVHGLIANRFDFHPDTRVFLHPGFLLSGGLHALGVPIAWVDIVFWKPIAAFTVAMGSLLYVRRTVQGGTAVRVAAVLAVFVLLPMSTVAGWFGAGAKLRYNLDFITSEMWPGQQLLGYEVAATAIFLVPVILLGVERAREGGRTGLLALCSVGALFVSWLQPWQGMELLIIVASVELWRRFRHGIPLAWRLLPIAVAGCLPAFYYASLERTDPAWKLYGETNRSFADPMWDWSWQAVAMCFAPFVLFALPALKRCGADWQQTALRAWPVAVVVVYLQPLGTFPFHSIQGLSIPLAALVVQGVTVWRPKWVPRWRWWSVLALLFVAIVPGTVHRLSLARDNVRNRTFPYSLAKGEVDALSWLERNPAEGGVLADGYAGLLVPSYAGRESYIGPRVLTPDFQRRSQGMNSMMFAAEFSASSGRPPSPESVAAAQLYVRATGARFIFEECGGWPHGAPDLMPLIGPLVQRERKFGCARVYVLKPTPWSVRKSAQLGAVDGP